MPNLPAPVQSWIDRTFEVSVHATSEALFPAVGDVPGFRETELAPRTIAYVRALPNPHRWLLPILFVAVEWLTPVLAPLGGRLSRRTPERRLAIVERWRASRIVPVRLLGDALRATLCMIHFSHPRMVAWIGETPVVVDDDGRAL